MRDDRPSLNPSLDPAENAEETEQSPGADVPIHASPARDARDAATLARLQSSQSSTPIITRKGAISRVLVAALFATIPRLFYDVDAHGLERVVGGAHTYFAISHKRDLDSLLPLPKVLGKRGWRALAGEVHFATRVDAFTRGFLARIVTRPVWLSWLLRPLNVGPIIRVLGAHPIENLHARPLEEWIREVITEDDAAQATAGATLTPATIHALAQAAGESDAQVAASPLRRLLAWRYHSALVVQLGTEVFVEDARRRAEWRVVRAVKRQIEDLARWFWQGGSLYTAPEGQLSPEGRLSPIISGLHRLLRLAPPDTRIVPIALIYDTMTTGRPRLFIDVAAPIEQAGALPNGELDDRLRAAWLGAMRFTCTQLASGALMRLRAPDPRVTALVTLDGLAQTVHQWAQRLAERGRNVDRRLLDAAQARRMVRAYIGYAQRRGLLRRVGLRRWAIAEPLPVLHVAPNDIGYPQAPLAYAYNEFQEMLSFDRDGANPIALDHDQERHPILTDAEQRAAHAQGCG